MYDRKSTRYLVLAGQIAYGLVHDCVDWGDWRDGAD